MAIIVILFFMWLLIHSVMSFLSDEDNFMMSLATTLIAVGLIYVCLILLGGF